MEKKESGGTNGTKRSKNIQVPDDFNELLEQELLEKIADSDYRNKNLPAVLKVPTVSKRISNKQCKESLKEYRETFLTVPKLENRKPVFVSREVRNQLDEIVRRLGGRRMSVSGFLENLARHHLNVYHEDIEIWRKL